MPSHDPEIYKDKIEVSLDGCQIFYLFFGGSVIVGLVFVLGVLVGRRVEARGHTDRADTSAARDPLAALDRLERPDALSFRGALTGAQTPTDVEKAIGEIERRRLASRAGKSDKPQPAAPTAPAAAAVDKPAENAAVDKPAAEKAAAVDKPAGDKAAADKHDGDKRDGDKAAADKAAADKRDGDKRDGAKPKKHDDGEARAEKSEAREAKKSSHGEPVTHPDGEARVRFTLQLSSFQDKAEAEAFLGQVKSAGFQPYLTEAEVTGKGTFYRVRLGSYRSLDAANDAKAEYEKSARKSAQVMRL